jgi:aldehyde:ferredoxin oxidoreductase
VTIEAGYAGKIFRVDLSSGEITWVPTSQYADRFVGGRGIAAKIYWDEVSPDVKPFDAENRLIFATGPLAGFTGLAGSRLQICGKSPATHPEMFCYANVGGSWGAELKFAGCDGIVIQGKSDRPLYLLVEDGVCEIRDASALWGRNSVEARESLKKELGSSARVLATGIAGENMVPFATVLADDDASGAGGIAAVMGSKKLKAIVVRGREKVIPANPEKLHTLTQHVRQLAKGRKVTPPTVREPPFPPTMKKWACYGCIAGCLRAVFEASNGDKGKFMCQQSGMYMDAAMQYYKRWTEVPFYASRLCDKYGLDTMVLAPLITWLCRCEESGILTDEQAGIPISKVGSLEFIESLIKKISLREGFGDILAQGIIKAADLLGAGAGELIGDLIFPKTGEEWVYDPRMFITTGIFYAMEPKRPIQHLHEISWLIAQWVAWKNGNENAYVSTDVVHWVAQRFWGSERAADFSTYEGKALAAKKIQDRQYVKECLILCDYAWPIAHVRHSEDHLGDATMESRIFSAVVGKEVSEEGLYAMAERVFNLQRAILVREGHKGKEADRLPEFSYAIPLEHTMHNPECLLPGEGGKMITRKGATVDKDQFESMRDEYYRYRGWDVTTGLQTLSKLKQLQLPDVAEELARRGLVVSD